MADLLRTDYRPKLLAATVLGQGKNFFQAEIDTSCELIDFLRFNAYFAQKIYEVSILECGLSQLLIIYPRINQFLMKEYGIDLNIEHWKDSFMQLHHLILPPLQVILHAVQQ